MRDTNPKRKRGKGAATVRVPSPKRLNHTKAFDTINIMTPLIHQSQENVSRWTAQTVGMSWDILDRMERAVTTVRERLLRATAALNQVGVPYAVVGGNIAGRIRFTFRI